MSITANVIYRTFQISFGKDFGTCFAVDYENRQYIVTARHIVETITDSAIIRIKHQKVWKDCPVDLVGHCDGEVDVSVLAAGFQLAPKIPLPPTSDHIALGQDVYFLGFPYGFTTEFENLNRNFPLPLVKKAILSAIYPDTNLLVLDGHNNPGFSGGPVVFSKEGQPPNKLSVAGVIAGYHYEWKPVYCGRKRTRHLEFKDNTGIILAYNIKHAEDLVRQNPIGFDLGS